MDSPRYVAKRLAQSHDDERSSVLVGRLLDAQDLQITLLSPLDDRDLTRELPIATTAVIELEDPRVYLNGFELLLITGLGLPTDADRIGAYIDRLVEAGITALGFGLEPVYSAVPQLLVDACLDRGLPLLEIAPEVRFVQVTNHVAKELESTRVRGLQLVSTMARRLTKAALLPHPDRQLVSALAAMTDSWLILRIGDELFQIGPPAHGIEAESLVEQFSQQLETSAHDARDAQAQAFGVVAGSEQQYEVTALSIRPPNARAATTTELLLVKAPRITSDDRTALMLAADLLQLVLALPRSQSNALDQLMMLLLIDETPPARSRREADRFSRLVMRSLGTGRRQSGHAVIAISATGEPAHAADVMWWRRLMNTPFVDHRGEQLRAIVATPPSASVIAACEERGWLLSISEEQAPNDLHHAMRDAELLITRVRELGRSVQSGEDLTTLTTVVPPGLSTRFATETLSLLSEAGAQAAEIQRTLHAWLLSNGAWDHTARELGLHRNTVRRQIATAADLLGRDLNNALVRADVLVALTITSSRRADDDAG